MIRLIARIDSRNLNHIKTVQCEGVKVVRPVIESLSLFSSGSNEHDEILVIDNVASLYGVGNWLTKFSQDHHYAPLPLAIGGGIRSLDEATRTLRLGADKVVLNTSAIESPRLLDALSDRLGRQALILQVDTRKINGDYYCFTHGARELSKYKVSEWIKMAQERGVGEVFITSIDTEGCNRSFPEELASIAAENTNLPIILSGGINDAKLIASLHQTFKIDAFCFSSIVNSRNKTVQLLRQELSSLGLPIRNP